MPLTWSDHSRTCDGQVRVARCTVPARHDIFVLQPNRDSLPCLFIAVWSRNQANAGELFASTCSVVPQTHSPWYTSVIQITRPVYGPVVSLPDHKVSGSAASIVPMLPFTGYLRGFWVPSKAPDSLQGPSDRIFLGFSSKRPKPRTPRTPPAGAKNSVRGCFAAEGHQKRPTLERLERSGEFKGVKGTEEVFEGGGARSGIQQ